MIKQDHLSYQAVAKKLKIDRHTVEAIWTKYQDTYSVHDRPRSGRKRKLSTKEEKAVVRAAKRGKNAPDIARTMKKKVSVQTIQRTLRQAGLKYLTIQETEHLTDVHKANRLKYAKEMVDFDWKTALFTDEKSFWLGCAPTHAWQDPKARKHREVSKHPPKLHVWAGAGYYMKTELFIFEENLTGELYRSIIQSRIQENEISYSPRSKAVKGKWMFVQDNDPKHKAKKTLKLLNELIGERIIRHPSYSPDLNPMENLWSYLDRKVKNANVKTLAGLKKTLSREWKAMPWAEIRKSVDSMPDRLQECIALNGGRTSY